MTTTTWQPNSATTINELGLLRRRVLRSLPHALSTIGLEFSANAQETIKTLDADRTIGPSAILHPYYMHWYYSICDAVKNRDATSAAELLTRHAEIAQNIVLSRERAATEAPNLSLPLDLRMNRELITSVTTRAEAMIKEMSGTIATMTYVDVLSSVDNESLRGGLRLIKRCWPDLFDEIGLILQQVIYFNAEDALGFSDFRSFGAVFVRAAFNTNDLDAAECILHEAAHYRLLITLANSPCFTNTLDERYDSPLRADPRPIFGIYNQMWVLVRLDEFYKRLDFESIAASSRALLVTEQLKQAVDVIAEHAKLTETGRQILDSVKVLVSAT